MDNAFCLLCISAALLFNSAALQEVVDAGVSPKDGLPHSCDATIAKNNGDIPDKQSGCFEDAAFSWIEPHGFTAQNVSGVVCKFDNERRDGKCDCSAICDGDVDRRAIRSIKPIAVFGENEVPVLVNGAFGEALANTANKRKRSDTCDDKCGKCGECDRDCR